VMEFVANSGATKVLDVGVGTGKYGFLCREYLEVYPGKVASVLREAASVEGRACGRLVLDGVEGFPGYLTPLHDLIYDHIYIGDALDVISRMDDLAYDLVLLIEVLEHLTQDAGFELLRHCKRVGRTALVVTPRAFCGQGSLFGNPLEVHRSLWTPRELRKGGADLTFVVEDMVIAVLGRPVSCKYATPLRRLRRCLRKSVGLIWPRASAGRAG